MSKTPADRLPARMLRYGVGGLLALLLFAMYTPMPVYGLWLLRFVARETALFGVGLAIILALLMRSRRERIFAGVLGLLASLPLLFVLPLFFRQQIGFSLREYVAGGSAPNIAVDRDVIVDENRPELRVDLYHGQGAAPHPFVLVIHGGSWQHGDKGDVPQVSRQLAAAGISVVDVRYRLSPEYRFPAAVQDIKCVLGRVRERHQALGLDPRRAALLGRSAGGQLALLAGFSSGDPTLPPGCAVDDAPLQAIVAVYPFVDQRTAFARPAFFDPEETRAVMQSHFGGTPSELPAAYERSNPAFYIRPAAQKPLPPTLFLHGSSDTLVPRWHSERLFEKLQAAAQNATLITIPLAEHGFDFRPGGFGEQTERALVTRFLAKTFGLK